MLLKIDLIVIGNQGSGKTSLTNRFIYEDKEDHIDDLFTHKYYATVGVNLQRKTIEVIDKNGERQKVDLHIWDTAGQEKYFSLTKSFFQRAHGVLVVYDLTDDTSFTRIEELWLNQINDSCKESTKKILIGNKSDLSDDRRVPRESGSKLARKFDIPFFETSAKHGDGVEEAFVMLGQMCFDEFTRKVEEEEPEMDKNFEIMASSKKGMDCWDKFKESLSNIMKKKNTNMNKKEKIGVS